MALLVLSGATACAVDQRLDRTSLEAELQAELLPSHPGLVRAVTCPDLADPAPGRSFVCAAQVGEQIIDIDVDLVAEGETLRAEPTIDDRFVSAFEVERILADTFSSEVGVLTDVDCGQPVVVLEPDDALTCWATDPGGTTRSFEVTVADDGVVAVSLAQIGSDG